MMIDTEYDKKICAWLEAHRDEILTDWMDLVRIPSVHDNAAPKAPYGMECARALKKAAQMLEQRRFSVRLNEDDGYALASYGNGDKLIGLFGHSDVVPAGDGWLFTEPFSPIIKEGRMIGRGCSDNKSGVMASICILQILRDCEIPISSTVQTFVGSNEESGMGDVSAFVKKEKMPDLSLVPDADFPCSLGEKGILRAWLQCKTPLNTIRDFRGGDAFNIVLDQAEVVLAPDARLEAQLRSQIADDSTLTLSTTEEGLVLTATGVAKHAAVPEGSVNATVLATNTLLGCDALDAADRRALRTVATLLSSHYGEGMGIGFADPDFGALTAVNGMVAMEEGKLRISLDIRYGTALPGTQLEQHLTEIWDAEGWETISMDNREGFSIAKDSPVPQIMVDICRELTGQERSVYRMAGGTYARYLKNAFAVGVTDAIPNHTESILEMPEGRGGAHQRDECINIDHFFQGVRILTHAVIQCDRTLNH